MNTIFLGCYWKFRVRWQPTFLIRPKKGILEWVLVGFPISTVVTKFPIKQYQCICNRNLKLILIFKCQVEISFRLYSLVFRSSPYWLIKCGHSLERRHDIRSIEILDIILMKWVVTIFSRIRSTAIFSGVKTKFQVLSKWQIPGIIAHGDYRSTLKNINDFWVKESLNTSENLSWKAVW